MAYFRRVFRKRRRSWYTRPMRRMMRRRARSLALMSLSGSTRKKETIVVQAYWNMGFTFAANEVVSQVTEINALGLNNSGVGATNLCHMELFKRYAALYDEVKCEGMVIRVSFAGTGFDRKCYTLNCLIDRKTQADDSKPTMAQIVTSLASKRQFINGQRSVPASFAVFPSGLQEKAMYIDTDFATPTDTMLDWFTKGKPMPFNPAFYFGLTANEKDSNQYTLNGVIFASARYTFRNPKGVSVN